MGPKSIFIPEHGEHGFNPRPGPGSPPRGPCPTSLPRQGPPRRSKGAPAACEHVALKRLGKGRGRAAGPASPSKLSPQGCGAVGLGVGANPSPCTWKTTAGGRLICPPLVGCRVVLHKHLWLKESVYKVGRVTLVLPGCLRTP